MQNLKEILKKIEKEHTYRVPGSPATYSGYNQGWSDCIERIDSELNSLEQEGNVGVPMNDFKIRQIVDFFGDEPQIRQAMEECAELIVALNKYLRYKNDPKEYLSSKKSVIEEMADVYVMLRQLEYILCENGEIENLSEFKIDRTLKIISERRTEDER